MKRLACALLAWAALAFGPTALRAAPPDLFDYVVRPGDSCWSIALTVLGDPRAYTVIHRHNALGPLPHVLTPGQILRLPAQLARPDARVHAPRRDVRARPPTALDWRAAEEAMGLWRLYRVATGAESSAVIRFRDAADFTMRAEALLVIRGGAAAGHTAARAPRTTVELEKGTLRGGLMRLDAEAALTVHTPASAVALKAADAQVEVDEARRSIVSVMNGVAEVVAQGLRVVVAGNEGTTVELGKRPARPRPLPPAPRFEPGVPTLLLVRPGERAAFEARWQPVPAAARYRVELARDARFRDLVADAVVGAGVLLFRAEALAPGAYRARVSAIDAARLESRPSVPLEVEVLPIETSRALLAGPDGTPEAAGLLALSLPKERAADFEWALDAAAPIAGNEPQLLVEPGGHTVHVRRRGAPGGAVSLGLRLLAVQAELALAPPAAGPPQVTLALTDERGRPAVLPGLTVTVSPGIVLDLRPTAAGRFAAPLPDPLPPLPLDVRAASVLGPLGALRLCASPAATAPAPAAPAALPAAPVALDWAALTPGHATFAASPTSRLGLSSALAAAPRGPHPSEPLALRTTLAGGLALLGGQLGLEFAWPFYEAPPAAHSPGSNETGDPRFAVSGVAYAGHGFVVAPALALTAPTGGFPRPRRNALFEPALRLAFAPRPWLALVSQQTFVLDADFVAAPTGSYASHYAVNVHFAGRFSVGAGFDALIGLGGPGSDAALRALTAGGALRLRLARVRLALTAGGALNTDALDRFGRFATSLSVELGFPGL